MISTQPAASASASVVAPPIGFYSFPPHASDGNASATTSTAYWVPIIFPKTMTFDRISVNVVTLQAASTARLGIYTDGGDGKPTTLLFDSGTVATTATGAAEITISQTIAAGLWWACCQLEGVTAATLKGPSNGNPILAVRQTPALGYMVGWSASNTGALPATAPAVATASSPPFVMLRRSA